MSTKSKVPRINPKEIGIVCIDTATLMLADPCYLDSMHEAFPRRGLSRQIIKRLKGGTAIPTGVTLMTGLGDGYYSVEAEFVDVGGGWGQRIKGIHIEFIPDSFWQKAAPNTSGEHADEDPELGPPDDDEEDDDDDEEEEADDALFDTAFQSAWDEFINSTLALNDMVGNPDAGFTYRELIDVVKAIAAQPKPDRAAEERRYLDRFTYYRAQLVYESFISAIFTLVELKADLPSLIEMLEKMDAEELEDLVEARDAGQLTDQDAIELSARLARGSNDGKKN
jgi:hypothetical protein